MPIIFLLFILVLSTSAIAEGFQFFSPKQHVPSTTRRLASSSTDAAATTLREEEMQTLFGLLSDTILLHDPSRGTCCRNMCSGCTYLDSEGNFAYDEYIAEDANEGGWLAPYVKVDFGARVQSSAWSQILFPQPDPPKAVERNDFAKLLGEPNVSPLALRSLWNALSPSAGYPRLTSNEIVRAIKGMEGSEYDKGGAANYKTFEQTVKNAAEQVVQLGGLDGGDSEEVDYDALEKEELLQLVEERGMKANFPKMKRIIIEELRFFDANGRQGKRHPVKNTLS